MEQLLFDKNNALRPNMCLPDLAANAAQSHAGRPLVLRESGVCREDTVCADHELSSMENLSAARFSMLQLRKLSYSHIFPRRTCSCPRVCTVDVLGKSWRHEGLSPGTIRHAVSHGPLGLMRFKEPETGKTLILSTNVFDPQPAAICKLHKARSQVQLFFKWVKQHVRTEKVYGTSENAVKVRIWTAVSVSVLVDIVKKTPQQGCFALQFFAGIFSHPVREGRLKQGPLDTKPPPEDDIFSNRAN